MANDIKYEKPIPSNNLVDAKEYQNIDTAIANAVALTNAGTTLVKEKEMAKLIAENSKDAKYIADNEIPDSEKMNIDNTLFIKSSAVIAVTHKRSEEHPDAKKRSLNQYTSQSLMNISNSYETKAQKGDYEDFAKKREKSLNKIRARNNGITNDEITGEPLKGSGDFHHKNKKTLFTDPAQRLDPDKGILVNKSTHQDIHKNNINDEKSLEEYKKRYKRNDK